MYPSIRPSVPSTHKHSEKKTNRGGTYPIIRETSGISRDTNPSSADGEGHTFVHERIDSINHSYGLVGPRIDI